jgi:hypothetical protein
MTEYTTPLTDAQQEISALLSAAKDGVCDLRELEGALRRVGLLTAADAVNAIAFNIEFFRVPVEVRFIKGEI